MFTALIAKIKSVSKRKEYIKVPNENYLTADKFTEHDHWMIDADRANTGIQHYSDEHYYNFILFQNYDLKEVEDK